MPSLVGSTIASRYHVVRLIGRGGMGEVYLAKHVHTGEQVAVKVLIGQSAAAKQTAERFKREMRAPGRIKSDHVVRVIDADVAPELDGALFLVMELLDGCDLDKPLKERGPYSPVEVAWIFGQVARGLEKAHALGIVHRDRSQISISHLRCTARTSQRRRDTDAAPHRSHASPYSYIL